MQACNQTSILRLIFTYPKVSQEYHFPLEAFVVNAGKDGSFYYLEQIFFQVTGHWKWLHFPEVNQDSSALLH